MKKTITTVAMAATMLLSSASAAQAGSPTCENMFDLGWANHGEHVLGYVNDGGAGGGRPAHLSARPDGPAPGASFCLDQANSPGLHPSDF